jgi:alpha-ribazole phosphatase
MRLYLVRHPRPVVEVDTCYGSSDLAVVPEECARIQAALLPLLPKNTLLISSPLRRCAELAHELASALGSAAPRHDPRLAEMDFGAWEMRTWDTIPRSEVEAWADDMVAYRPGNGESVLQVAQRVQAFFHDLPKLGAASAIVVCHAGTIRLLTACERGLSVPEMASRAAHKAHQIGYGELLVMDC